jgi:F0F1-type ATP synthase gamma subunit
MKPIKSVTFEALDNLANEIHSKSTSTIETINEKIADYLITDGNKKFVETYNELATTNDFEKAIKILKI